MVKSCKFGCQSWLAGVSNVDPKIAIDFYDYYSKMIKKINNIINYIEAPFNKIKDKFSWHLTIKSCLKMKKLSQDLSECLCEHSIQQNIEL